MKNISLSIKLKSLAALTLFSFVFNACQEDDLTEQFQPAPTLQDGTAKMRFIHAAPNLDGVSVRYNESSVVGDSLRYKNFSGYTDIAIGSSDNAFKLDMIALLDSTNGQSGTSEVSYYTPNKDGFVANFAQVNFLLKKDVKYVCFVYDTAFAFTGPVLDQTYAALHTVLTENYTVPISGICLGRFLNLSETAGTVDLVLTNTSTMQIITISNVSFTETSLYGDIPSGNYNLEIQQGGSPLTTRSGVDLQEGKAYTMYLRGIKNVSGDKELQLEIITNGE